MPARRSPSRSVPEPEPQLKVPCAQMDRELDVRIELAQQLLDRQAQSTGDIEQLQRDYRTWDDYNEELLLRRFTSSRIANKYTPVIHMATGRGTPQQEWERIRRDITRQQRKLDSIKERLELFDSPSEEASTTDRAVMSASPETKIFVVHGHNGAVKLQVAEFLEKVTGGRPIILHEQADGGSRAIIEKFEEHAGSAGFAVILLTGDDVGGPRDAKVQQARARQNVVFEFGYFVGRLGRGHVVALHEEGVELPSDVSGVLYKPLAGNWHTELAKDLKAAGIDADLGWL